MPFPNDICICNPRPRWTLLTELNENFHVFLFAFKDSFDPTVWQVANPTLDIMFFGFTTGFGTEEHALNPTNYEDMRSDQHARFTAQYRTDRINVSEQSL